MKLESSHKLIVAMFMALSLIVPGNLFGQDGYIKRGNKRFKKFDFQEAAMFYKKALKKDPGSKEATLKLADSYRLMNDIGKAEKYYSKVVEDPSTEAVNHYHYGQALRSNEYYDEAKLEFEEYSNLNPADNSGLMIARDMNRVTMAEPDPAVEVTLLPFNTSYDEFAPSFYKKGIVFPTNRADEPFVKRLDLRTQKSFLQLFYAEQDYQGGFRNPVLFEGKGLNGKYHEGPLVFYNNESLALLTRSNYLDKNEQRGNNGIVSLQLFSISYNASEDHWGSLKNNISFNNPDYSIGHPAVSSDGRILVFMSDMPGGFGGTDLYFSERRGAGWSEPVNLGSDVNTSGNELFPFLSEGDKLYFASDGHPGLGGLDIYSAEQTAKSWSRIANLGSPINSNMDDFSYIIDEEKGSGYFASNRYGGYGGDDIYEFTRKGITISGTVIDEFSGEPVAGALVEIPGIGKVRADNKGKYVLTVEADKKYKISVSDEDYLGVDKNLTVSEDPVELDIKIRKAGGFTLTLLIQDKKSLMKIEDAHILVKDIVTGEIVSCKSDVNGRCSFEAELEKEYEVSCSKDLPDPNKKYLNVKQRVNTSGREPGVNIITLIEMELVEIGVAIKIDNIYYDLDRWVIRPDAAIELDKVLKVLEDNPTISIELSSHTDSRGSDIYNKDLSSKRARSAVDYIVSQGVSQSRIQFAGYGEERPVNKCSNGIPCSEEEHQENRRTEFKILQF